MAMTASATARSVVAVLCVLVLAEAKVKDKFGSYPDKMAGAWKERRMAEEFEFLDGSDGWVATHNYFRHLHGAGDVTWDSDLAAKAQAHADELNSAGGFYHSDSYNDWPPSGENLAMGYGACQAATDYGGPAIYTEDYDQHCAVASWYGEYYLWTGDGDWQDVAGIGHFTAMVWKGIDAIGCASAGNLYVCEYGSQDCKNDEEYGGYGCWGTTPPHLPNFNSDSCEGGECVGDLEYDDEVCEDDDEGFVYNASLQNITVTSCADDAAGFCGIPEAATFCCATCAEALTVCADHDDTLALMNFDPPECSLAFLYGLCENEDTSFLQHMCCESCSSSNATCQDYDDIVATLDAEGVETCSDVAVYGWCDGDDGDYVRSICCESCSNPVCEDYDDIVATWDNEQIETCSDFVLYGLCYEDSVAWICCESCANPVCEDHDDIAATWDDEGMYTCSYYALYGLCDDDDNVARICCESCSNPVCEDHDDIVATWDIEGIEKCSDIAMYGYCEQLNVETICCESCSEPEPTPEPAPTPAPCADNDNTIVALASNAGITIGGCDDVKSFCEHGKYGSTVQATCPETCGLCCADDDDTIVALASNAGITIGGCDDVKSFCDHGKYGSTMQETCPVTCDSCTRRLADGKRIDELTGMASLMPARAAGIRQKTDEFSSPDTSLFYP